MNNIAKIIKQTTGQSIKDFCEQDIHTNYKAFIARVKDTRLYPAEIFYIVYKTKKSVKEIFDKDWEDLLLLNHESKLTEKVKGIIDQMSDGDKAEMMSLMGVQKYLGASSVSRETTIEVPEVPVVKEEKEVEPSASEEDSIDLKSLFRKTY